MSTIINGTWNNAYGSSMDLLSDGNQIFGTYSSHTGSTGTYLLLGHCSDIAPTDEAGLNITFSIFWRNIKGTDYDDSWHWTGSMCGQLLANGEMTLENIIVVSVPFEQFSKGNYVDQLVFTKDEKSSRDNTISKRFSFSNIGHDHQYPLLGNWCNRDSQLTISQVDPVSGFAKGLLIQNGQEVSLLGFIDTYVEPKMDQSFTFSGFSQSNNKAITVCGRLESNASNLMMYEWIANSTPSETSFMQTQINAQYLTKKKL